MILAVKCYVCGDEIKDLNFVLSSPHELTDRVFIQHERCAKQLDKENYVLNVEMA